jgi:hypothetical protein
MKTRKQRIGISVTLFWFGCYTYINTTAERYACSILRIGVDRHKRTTHRVHTWCLLFFVLFPFVIVFNYFGKFFKYVNHVSPTRCVYCS